MLTRIFNSLRSRLTLLMLFLAVLPLLGIGAFLTQRAFTTQRDQAVELEQETAARLAAQIELFIRDRARQLELIAQVRGLQDLPEVEQRLILSEMLSFDSIFDELILLDGVGQEVVRESRREVVTETILTDLSEEPEFTEPVATRETYYSRVRLDVVSSEPLMTIGVPLVDLRSGDIAYVLVGRFRFRAVWELIQAEDLGEGQDLYLIEGAPNIAEDEVVDELVVAHSNPSVVLGNTGFDVHNRGSVGTGLHGDEVVLGLSTFTVGNQNFTMVSELTTEVAYREAQNTLVTVITVLVGVILLVGFGGFLALRFVTNPVAQLADVAERIGAGDFNLRAEPRGGTELVTLSGAFNTMTERLRDVIDSLETRVAERTRDLFLTLEVGQLSTRIYQQAELLPRVAEFVRERFDLYYTQIYLTDDVGRYARLMAGTGEVGQQLLARGHRLDLSQTSIVARAAQSQRPVLVEDTRDSDIHMPNPMLPETRSEVAIPLIVGDQVMGVLDMQARDAETFREDNLPVFEAMANQLASALRSASSYAETQIAVERADEINRRLTGEAWESYLGHLGATGRVGYRYDLTEVKPLDKPTVPAGGGGNGQNLYQPVRLRNQEIGMIQLAESDEREWTAEDRALVEAVADRVGQALEQFRAFDQTQVALSQTEEQARRLAMLNDLAAEMGAAETLNDVYRVVADRTDAILRSDRASIALITEAGNSFQVFGLSGEQGAIPLGSTLPMEGTWLGKVMSGGRTALLPDMSRVEYPEAQMLAKQGLRSSLNAPLYVGGRVAGTLNVAVAAVDAYTRRDEDLLTQIASLLSAQIENRQLLQTTEKRAREMQAVAEVGAEASSALDPEQLLWDVVELAKERFGLYHAHIYLVDDTQTRLRLAAGAGEPGRLMVSQRRTIAIDHEHSIVARAARERQGVIVNDVTRAPDFLPNPMLPHTRAELAVPMLAGDQVIGVLDLQSETIEYFSEDDLQVQGTLAAQLAVAVQNARLYEQTQERERQFRAVFEGANDAIFILDPSNGEFISWNTRTLEIYGTIEEEIVGKTPAFFSPSTQPTGESSDELAIEYIAAAAEGTPQIFEWLHRRPDGSEFYADVSLSPLEIGGQFFTQAVVRDVTERRQAEAERERFLIETQARYEAGRQLVAAQSYDDVLNALARYAFRDGAIVANLLNLELNDQGDPERVQIVGTAMAHDEVVGQLPVGTRLELATLPFSQLWISEPDHVQLISDVNTDERVDPETRALYLDSGQQAAVIIPLTLAGQWVGIASFGWEQPHYFTDGEERFYTAMSGQMASVLQSLRLIEQTQRAAREMQTMAEVGATAAASLDPNELLWTVSRLTKERFGLYHAHIYLMDETDQYLLLVAGAGEVGEAMVDAGYRIASQHPRSLVARAARDRLGVIVSDVTTTEDFLPNPMLPDTRSEMAVPMIVGDTVIGVVDVQSEEVNHFSEDDLSVQSTLAAQIAVAVNNARLFNTQVISARQRETLNEMSQAILEVESVTDIFQIVAETLVAHFGMAFARVWVVNPNTDELVLQVSTGMYTHLDGEHSRVALDGDRKLARIARSREPHITNDLLGDPWIDDNEWVEESRMQAFAGYPVFIGDELVGLIGMFSLERISSSTLPILETMALQAGTLIENQRLFDQAAKRAAEMQTVAEVGAVASATLDPDELLWTVANLARDQFNLYHAHIYLLDGEMLRLAAGAGSVGRAMVAAGHRIMVSHERSLVARAVRDRQGVIVNDVTGAPNFLPNPMLPDTRSEMAIPMIVGDTVIGVLDVQANEVARFTDEDLRVQTTLATQVAVAVQNARSFSTAQQRLAIIESAANLILLASPERDIIYMNPYGLEWLGYEHLEDVVGQPTNMLYDATEMTALVDEITTALAETGQWIGEAKVVHQAGYTFPAEVTTFVITDIDGEVEFLASIMTDITDRVAAQAQLENQRLTLEALLANLPVGVFMSEAGTGRTLQVNARALEMLGRGLAPDAAPDELAEVYAAYRYGTDEPYPSDQMPLVRGMMGESTRVDDMEIHRSDGSQILLEVSGAPIHDADGNVTAGVAVFQDITERRAAEAERERLLEDLQATSDALAERIKELAALQDVGAYGEENLALEEYLTRVANRIPASMQYPEVCVSVIEFGGEVYGDARALDAPVFLENDLDISGRVLGRMVVGYTEERDFAQEEIPHLRDIASRVGNYLENRQLFEQTERSLAETEMLYAASRLIVEAATVQDLVAAVASTAGIDAVNRAVLFTFETSDRGEVTALEVIGNWHSGDGDPPNEVGRIYDAATFPFAHIIRTDTAIYIDDAMTDDRMDDNARVALQDQRIASAAILPLWIGRRQLGALVLEAESQHTFTASEIRPFSTLIGQMAVGLESLLLLEQTQKRATEMQAVAEVGAEAASSLEIDRLLKTVSDLTKDRFDLYHAHVYLLDDTGEYLVLRAGAGQAGDRMAQGGHRIPVRHQQSLVVQAALTQQPVIVNSVTEAPDFLPNPMLPLTKAELATPMIAGGEVIGVLDVQADRANQFTIEDVQVQLTLASQVAVAVQNARLFAEQVEVAEQLREVDRLKSEFLASMSHELRTPLNSIIGYAEVLLDGIDGDLTEDMEEDVGAIHGSGKHLLNLINDILDLAKIEAGQMDLVREEFDLLPVAEDMANTNRILLKDKPVNLVLDIPDDLPLVDADSLRVRQVISNLLTNAIKFTEEGDILLKAAPYAPNPAMVCVSITDSGIGMNEQQVALIFDRFRQVDQSHTRRAGGTGLGLSITRQLVEMHGGDIWVESTPGVGSTFNFTLPFAETEPA